MRMAPEPHEVAYGMDDQMEGDGQEVQPAQEEVHEGQGEEQ